MDRVLSLLLLSMTATLLTCGGHRPVARVARGPAWRVLVGLALFSLAMCPMSMPNAVLLIVGHTRVGASGELNQVSDWLGIVKQNEAHLHSVQGTPHSPRPNR